MQYGNAVERLVALEIANDTRLARLYEHVGRKSNPDFLGRGLFQGLKFDITTPRQVHAHLNRPGYGQDLIIIIYERPAAFP
jgi:hypothetical protein